MEICFIIFVVIMISDLEAKVTKIYSKINSIEDQKISKINKKSLILDDYIGKKVSIAIDNNDIKNSYNFSSVVETPGEIVEYDNEWLVFKYYNKKKKKYINQYFRRRDIISINEISTQKDQKNK